MLRALLFSGFLACLLAPVGLGNLPMVHGQDDNEDPLLQDPKNAMEMFDAIVLYMKLGNYGLAEKRLGELNALNPDDATLIAIWKKHGPAAFARLTNIRELQAASAPLKKRMNEALRKSVADIDKLIDDYLQDPVNITILHNVGQPAVPVVMKRIGSDAGNYDKLVNVLSTFPVELAAGPLRGGLDADNSRVRSASVQSLGLLAVGEAIPELDVIAFNPNEDAGLRDAAKMARKMIAASPRNPRLQVTNSFDGNADARLKRNIGAHFSGSYRWDRGADGKVPLWMWTADAGTVTEQSVSRADASSFTGMKLARAAMDVAPTDETYARYFMGFLLARDSRRVGWNDGLPMGSGTAFDAALLTGDDFISDVLDLSLDQGNGHAARGALAVLSAVGARRVAASGKSSPVAKALNAPDARVRMEAVQSILALDPVASFSGSHRVMQELSRAATNSGKLVCLVADARQQQGLTIGAMVSDEFGYTAQIANTGAEAFTKAATHGDVALIMIEMNIARWALSQTLANLRADARTRGIPIVVYGSAQARAKIQQQLMKYDRATYVEEANTSSMLKTRMEPFLNSVADELPSLKERNRMTKEAIYSLAELARTRRTDIYRFDKTVAAPLTDAVLDKDMGADAITALSAVGTREAQQTLQDVSVTDTHPDELRERAAFNLNRHIRKFGMLLNAAELMKVRAARDAAVAKGGGLATQLTAVLGTLERSKDQVQSSLRGIPLPKAP